MDNSARNSFTLALDRGKQYLSRLYIQLFRERLSEKMCTRIAIPKGNMGYDQYTVPDTVAVEPTFVTFL